MDCPICLEQYSLQLNYPRKLDCGHGMCYPCSIKLCQKNVLRCPMCRETTNKLLEEIETNSEIEQVLQRQQQEFRSSCKRDDNYIYTDIVKKSQDEYVLETHQGYKCNNCDITPIVGLRYTCLQCPQIQYCHMCEHLADHNHPLIGFVNPLITAEARFATFKLESIVKSSIIRNVLRKMYKEARGQQKTSYNLEVLDHPLLPLGSLVVAGTFNAKSWMVKNTGAKAWPEGTQIILRQGALLCDNQPVPCLKPQQECELELMIEVPEEVGTYRAKWCLMTQKGRKFGDLDLFVKAMEKDLIDLMGYGISYVQAKKLYQEFEGNMELIIRSQSFK